MARSACGFSVALLWALLLGTARLLRGTEASEIVLPVGSGVTVHMKLVSPALPVKPCYIVMSRQYVTELIISPGERKSFTFSCRNPEKFFVLKIEKNIELKDLPASDSQVLGFKASATTAKYCMLGPCPFGEVRLQPSTSELPVLNRTFIWDVRAHKSIGLELQFATPRLRQIGPGESCADGVTHAISGHIDATEVKIGTFCSNGTVSRIKMQEGVKMALHLPWFHPRNFSGFSIANRSSIKRLCIIESVFEGEGSATLMSANYPGGFPEDELMTWQFVVPAHLRASVSFLNFNVSNCERKEERVEYYIPGSTTNPEVFRLEDKQPGNMAGNFNLSLQGCDQDAQSPGILRLQFQVLVQRPQNESNKTYTVDLSQERAMSLTIEPRPVKHGRRGCLDHRYCYKKPFSLRVPPDILQLPVQLHDFSWKLLVPKDKLSLMLVPGQKLQQHTREKPCNTSFGYHVAGTTPGEELYFGSFCPGGSIEKIRVKQNSVVTLRTYAPSSQQEVSKQGLTGSFIPYFKEEGIFTVTPDTKNKVYLRSPNWDHGLPALSSVSWNISVPSNQVARLTFFRERSGLACQSGRAFMIIQEPQTRAEEIFSLEEEILPKPSFHHHSFWVNISNCSPMNGKQLDLLFLVTLTPKTVDLAVIIGAAGGGALLLFALGLIICFVKKKKKVDKGPAVGIYNGNVNTQVPRTQKFQKRRKDNDSHVYAVIDDTMVYGHLLQDSGGSFTQPEVDTYRPFQGPMGNCPPTPPPIVSRTPTAKFTADELAPSSPPESESEPYTFSHPNKVEVGVRETGIPLLNIQGPVEETEE
ncbi:CUB domain-containing protein 1 [Apodemus speciosus]|uniref:CUB domain-containing protein 1 n=1 Tax=Apodemus speciosus TaxID=105296 RepID=A0ABQ0F6K6_APOSI